MIQPIICLVLIHFYVQAKITKEMLTEARKNAASRLMLSQSEDTQPNFIVFFPDDFGYNDVNYSSGLGPLNTQNIDMLANDGVRFTNYYTGPICTPARCALMTGRHIMRTGCHNDAGGNLPWSLNLNEILIPEILMSGGYHSVLYGKWHLGYHSWEHMPTMRGFDEFRGFLGGGVGQASHMSDDVYDWWNGTSIDSSAYGEYVAYLVEEYMYDLIDRHVSGALAKPFFAYLPMSLPHGPLGAPEEYTELFEEEWGEDSDMTLWLSELMMLDDLVGNIWQYLAAVGILWNTYIIFAGDHGAPQYEPDDLEVSRNFPFSGGKGSLWEGGVRCPAWIYNPNINTTTLDTPTSVIDWLPTLAELGGVSECDVPANIDGVSLVNLWTKGEEDNYWRTLLVDVDPECGSRRRQGEEGSEENDDEKESGDEEEEEGGNKEEKESGDEEEKESGDQEEKESGDEEEKDSRDEDEKDSRDDSEEKDEGGGGKDGGGSPSAALRYGPYKLTSSCVDYDGQFSDQYFYNLEDDLEETTNLLDSGLSDDEEDIFNLMVSALTMFAQEAYPTEPDWNEGVYYPDLEQNCGYGYVDGMDTLLPWSYCSQYSLGNNSLENSTWTCESYCTDAIGGAMPSQGVKSNRAEGTNTCPTQSPSVAPSVGPTSSPSVVPTYAPTGHPTQQPSLDPTLEPSLNPTLEPSANPTFKPSSNLTLEPSSNPTLEPSANPTFEPSANPTLEPSENPTLEPSANSALEQSANPTLEPSANPTSEPSANPTLEQSANPTLEPSANPTLEPSANPTWEPISRNVTVNILETVGVSAGSGHKFVLMWFLLPVLTIPSIVLLLLCWFKKGHSTEKHIKLRKYISAVNDSKKTATSEHLETKILKNNGSHHNKIKSIHKRKATPYVTLMESKGDRYGSVERK